jgi:Chitin binding Peritrophin-A domain
VCSDGGFFNEAEQKCDQWDVEHCYIPEDSCKGVEYHNFVKNPDGDCQDYYACFQGNGTPQRCDDGFYFNEEQQICANWDPCKCLSSHPNDPCNGKKHLTSVGRPTGTCAAYYLCEYGRGVPMDCPEGFYFDEANQMCNFPEKVACSADRREGSGKFRLPTLPTPATTKLPVTAPTRSSSIKE